MTWQLQAAKQRFSELVREATERGPQVVTKHGKKTVVVLSMEEYENLVKPKGEKKMDFKEFLMSGPPTDELEIERSKELPRDIEL